MMHSTLLFLNIGGQEMIFIFIVALFLFGGKKLPELARGLGRGIREFKDASETIKRDINDQINDFEKEAEKPVAPKAVAENATPAPVEERRLDQLTDDELRSGDISHSDQYYRQNYDYTGPQSDRSDVKGGQAVEDATAAKNS
jgi:sec-independent protein translocase protein TatA